MTLRARTADLYEVYWAINVFAQRLDSKQFAEMERTSAAIASMPRNRLREFLSRLQSEVSDLAAELQLTNPEELLRLFRTARDTRPGELVYISKQVFAQHFGAYDKVFLTFSKLPPHTRIAVDVFGIFPERRASFFLLEASLFEDMAALWNSTVGNPLPPTSVEALGSPLEVKRHFALLRSTLRATFALLEGYLNGLAADIYLTRTDLTQNELTSLTEWDSTEERHKALGFREKVHRYPRIAIASKHPPITESSSQAFALLLEAQTRLRHAVIHPTPLGKTDNGVPSREQVHHNLTQDEVADVCDAAIQLILGVSTAIEHRFGGVDWWLKPRADSGLFGNEVFL